MSDQITFTMDGVAPFETTALFDGNNVKIDYLIGEEIALLPGDFDFDGQLTVADIDALSLAVRANSADTIFDVDGSGVLDQDDRTAWLDLANSLLGDANLNGNVEFLDFLALANGFGKTNTSWSEGDFNGSGDTEFLDFLTLANYFGQSSVSAATVPEPNAGLAGLLGIAALVTKRRRRFAS